MYKTNKDGILSFSNQHQLSSIVYPQFYNLSFSHSLSAQCPMTIDK